VRRDGAVATLPADELVPGDIVLLEAGNVVPADLRLIEAAQLRLSEAALTGESQPVEKHVEALPSTLRSCRSATARNMAYKGTLVANGRGTRPGRRHRAATELGRIAGCWKARRR
jgi:Ca2+-transporting ATPase